MPVTAKLSRKFYERFGDDLTNELVEWFNQVDATYRSELREANELNWARFEAKLEQRIAEVRADLRAGLANLETKLVRSVTRRSYRVGTCSTFARSRVQPVSHSGNSSRKSRCASQYFSNPSPPRDSASGHYLIRDAPGMQVPGRMCLSLCCGSSVSKFYVRTDLEHLIGGNLQERRDSRSFDHRSPC